METPSLRGHARAAPSRNFFSVPGIDERPAQPIAKDVQREVVGCNAGLLGDHEQPRCDVRRELAHQWMVRAAAGNPISCGARSPCGM